MVLNLSAHSTKTILILSVICLSSCSHYCLNYADMEDCDTQVKLLRQQVKELANENRKLRLYSCSELKDQSVTTELH